MTKDELMATKDGDILTHVSYFGEVNTFMAVGGKACMGAHISSGERQMVLWDDGDLGDEVIPRRLRKATVEEQNDFLESVRAFESWAEMELGKARAWTEKCLRARRERTHGSK